eukprot:gnl/TRDRNA2_/TRDRNA2_177759_c4_seq14.p1 gnl/TRDRNA2_/TRDRNA2_177759_c4~~gnl/TRDRNA2_/TRDRNA2_177759_c4_seq14.p1  ORF type:complete len:110 (+),score=5.07 gnl/TRDRNA2_/TRDRNA2_177759_c4_seq14:298-627(+)
MACDGRHFFCLQRVDKSRALKKALSGNQGVYATPATRGTKSFITATRISSKPADISSRNSKILKLRMSHCSSFRERKWYIPALAYTCHDGTASRTKQQYWQTRLHLSRW